MPRRALRGALRTGLLLCLLAEILIPRAGSADERTFTVQVTPADTASGSSSFQLNGTRLLLRQLGTNPDGTPSRGVVLTGRYQKRDARLLLNRKVIDIDPQTGAFQARIPLVGALTEVALTGIDPYGRVEQQWLRLFIPEWAALNRPRPIARKRWNARLGAGISYVSYRQPAFGSLTEVLVTPKLALTYQFLPTRWDVGISSYFAALPLAASRADVRARYLGINLKAGYTFTRPSSPWIVKLAGGFYYTTMFVTGAHVGYHNAAGPELFPFVQRTLDARGSAVSAYLKFAPVSSGVTVFSLASHEIAGGIGFQRPLASGSRSWSVNLDASQLILNLTTGAVESSSLTLGGSFEW